MYVNGTLIVQTGSHDHYLGKVTIDISHKRISSIGAQLIDEKSLDRIINSTDTYILNHLNQIDDDTNKLLNKVIIHNTHKLSGDRLLVRREESELGNLAAEACQYITKADISVVNGGDIRTDLPIGDVTYKDLLAIFPFLNAIQTYRVKGQVIKDMLEHSVEFAPASFGGFLHISSNAQFTYNPSSEPNNRVSNILIRGEAIDPNKYYILSLSEFLAIGGDDYAPLNPSLKVEDYGTLEDIFIRYIKEVGIHEKNYRLGRVNILK